MVWCVVVKAAEGAIELLICNSQYGMHPDQLEGCTIAKSATATCRMQYHAWGPAEPGVPGMSSKASQAANCCKTAANTVQHGLSSTYCPTSPRTLQTSCDTACFDWPQPMWGAAEPTCLVAAEHIHASHLLNSRHASHNCALFGQVEGSESQRHAAAAVAGSGSPCMPALTAAPTACP